MKITKKQLKRIIKEEYNKRLQELEIAATIAETSVVDKRGNFLLTKDLKVKHKDSGYEYTVSHVDGKGEHMVVYLRNPDVARINPPGSPESYEGNAMKPTDYLAVTLKEFQKDYIVE